MKGIVGWVDMNSKHLNETIKNLKNESNRKLVALRHVLDWESDKNWVVSKSVKKSLKIVFDNDLTFDLL